MSLNKNKYALKLSEAWSKTMVKIEQTSKTIGANFPHVSKEGKYDYIQPHGWVIIDCMMNLNLLFWASQEIKDPRYKHIAMAHADTVLKEFIREDGSTYHIVQFDPEMGQRVGELADKALLRNRLGQEERLGRFMEITIL
jgi:hypothetical protein